MVVEEVVMTVVPEETSEAQAATADAVAVLEAMAVTGAVGLAHYKCGAHCCSCSCRDCSRNLRRGSCPRPTLRNRLLQSSSHMCDHMIPCSVHAHG